VKKENKVRKRGRRCIVLAMLAVLCSAPLFSQQSLIFTEVNANFRNAKDLFDKEKYVAAQNYFAKTIEEIRDAHSEIRIDDEYYRAICAIELFHANAEALLKKFVEDHPESPHVTSAYFNLAKFQFRKHKYEDVIDYLEKIDPKDLSEGERNEYYFKKGYAHFNLNELDKAADYFYEIKDTDNVYVTAARYYYAHIAYTNKKYQTAAENFMKLENDPNFGPVVPYYLSQIYYLQGKYEDLLAYAPAVLDSAPPKREEEIRKLIGDAYYETRQFKEALPYLEAYLQRNQGNNQDYYQLGYAYFQDKRYEQAKQSLHKAIGSNDTLSQSAYYFIGEACIKIEDKRGAKTAFRNAYQLDIEPELTEDALFNYAKTAYELSYHPYDDAILAFEEYINKYPNSSRLNDAYEYLVGVYYTTKNYEEALNSIDRIKSQNIKLLQAKQRLAYYRGVELFHQESYLQAIDKFKLSLSNNYDPKLRAAAIFWMAESYFRTKDYSNADNYYADFLSSSGARQLDYFEKGYYNLAYSHYESKNYKSAIFWFKEYIENADFNNKGLINDSYLRIGDSYFIQKDYQNAIKHYDEAAKLSLRNEDYALLQSAVASGVLGNYKAKVKKLEVIIRDHSSSVYTDDALYELGKTNLILNREAEALSYYNQLISDFPNSDYLAETYLKIGLIHYNRKEDDAALASFDKVIKSFGASRSSKEALDKIRKIYIDKGDASAFQDYVNGVPFADISKNELDSTSYVIAENAYLSGNCEKASRDFTNYLKQYPQGLFLLNAHYYRGDCEAKSSFNEEAILDLEYVVSQTRNKFTEKSLVALGRLYQLVNKEDSAIKAYERLKLLASRKGNIRLADEELMQLYFQKEDYEGASKYANILLARDVEQQGLWQKAHLILAKSSFRKEDYKQAIQHLDSIAGTSNELGAEAKYLLARTYYLQGLYDKSDTTIYRLVDQIPSYPYWIAKGFILLADNFVAKEDFYNARVTFQSVIDNADNEELISIAKEKLRMLNEAEEKKNQKEGKEIEVEFNNGNVKDEALFEEDSLLEQDEEQMIELKKELEDEK
jgi:TolA-binding protein